MRQIRKLVNNASYHVIARINRQEYIFNSQFVKNLFLLVVSTAKKKYRFTLRNFCIMGNHIHFIIFPHAQENLSKIMQWILSVFARRYNIIFKLKGHVWYDRFKSKIIYSLRQYLKTFEYITNNPVIAGIVKSPELYKYNGIWFMNNGFYNIVNPPDLIVKLYFPDFFFTTLLLEQKSINSN